MHEFIKYEIKDVYPSISEKWLLEDLKLSKCFVDMPPEQVELNLHWRKSVLFQNGEEYIKKSGTCAFDVPQGLFDGAEVSKFHGPVYFK